MGKGVISDEHSLCVAAARSRSVCMIIIEETLIEQSVENHLIGETLTREKHKP